MDKLILIAGSSGSIKVLIHILTALPIGFIHPIVIVIHRKAEVSKLAQLLQGYTSLIVNEVEQYDNLKNGHVYLAPPDYHLLVNSNGSMELDFSEKVLFSRPSIDVSLISFSALFKNNMIAVILTGANRDGADGSAIVKERGGRVIVQDPVDSAYNTMPEAAIEANENVDAIVPIEGIATKIIEFINY